LNYIHAYFNVVQTLITTIKRKVKTI